MRTQNENSHFLRSIRVTLLATFAVIVQLFDITATAQMAPTPHSQETQAAQDHQRFLQYLEASQEPPANLRTYLSIAASELIPQALSKKSLAADIDELKYYHSIYLRLLNSPCGVIHESNLAAIHVKICQAEN